jgi:hypothetical protein
MMLLQFLPAVLSFGAFYTESSWKFYESPRRIDKFIYYSSKIERDTFMLVKNILG